MSRTVGPFCSRDATYALQAQPMHPAPMAATETPNGLTSDAPTWQRQQKFESAVRKNKGKLRWTAFDFEAVKDTPIVSTTGTGDTPPAQQAVVPRPRLRPRGKLPAKAPDFAIKSDSTGPVEKNTAPQADAAEEPAKQNKSRGRRPQTTNSESAKMKKSIPPHIRKKAAESVPPHLLKKTAAPAPAAPATDETALSRSNGSASSSDQVSPQSTPQPQVTPDRPSEPLTPPSSIPATPKEPEFETTFTKAAPEVKPPAEQVSEPQEQKPKGCVWDGWDEPVPNPPPVAPRRNNNPRWPRLDRVPKKHVWPKQSEMRAPTVSSSDGGVSCKSDSQGDPDYDVKKLMDWNGEWLPPPEQWQARKGHTSRHFGSGIEKWIDEHPEECTKAMDDELLSFLEDGACKEIVPRYWLLTTIESQPPAEFWRNLPARTPAALSDIDVHVDAPFWDRFDDKLIDDKPSYFLDGLVVPEARVDPEDPDNHYPGRDILASVEYRINLIHQTRARAQQRTIRKQTRPLRETKPSGPPVEDRRIRPKSNVYFRPVQPNDVEGIAAIYNHYVEKTIFASEFEGRTASQVADRINDIKENGLPYLVAVARGNQPRGPHGYISEKIVGFIYLDDLCDRSSMYRYAYELGLYVHPGYLSQNIGSCLLDCLLEISNTGYNACKGYEYRNNSEYLKTGTARVIKTIILNVNKENGADATKTNETHEFLKRFKFRYAGHIKEIGHKLGKVVDEYKYVHTTTEAIDPNGRPGVPLQFA